MESCTVCPFTRYWYVVIAVLVAVWAVYKFTQSRSLPPLKEIAGVENLAEADFAAAVANGMTLVDFWAPWCGPCRMQIPVIEETIGSLPEGVKIAMVNMDEAPGLAQRLGVRGVPTWIVFRNGVEIHRADGFQTGEMLLKLAETK